MGGLLLHVPHGMLGKAQVWGSSALHTGTLFAVLAPACPTWWQWLCAPQHCSRAASPGCTAPWVASCPCIAGGYQRPQGNSWGQWVLGVVPGVLVAVPKPNSRLVGGVVAYQSPVATNKEYPQSNHQYSQGGGHCHS